MTQAAASVLPLRTNTLCGHCVYSRTQLDERGDLYSRSRRPMFEVGASRKRPGVSPGVTVRIGSGCVDRRVIRIRAGRPTPVTPRFIMIVPPPPAAASPRCSRETTRASAYDGRSRMWPDPIPHPAVCRSGRPALAPNPARRDEIHVDLAWPDTRQMSARRTGDDARGGFETRPWDSSRRRLRRLEPCLHSHWRCYR